MKTIFAWTLLLTSVCLSPALAANQVLLRYINPPDGTPQALAADRGGHLFVVSGLPPSATRVVELDLAGSRLASVDLAQVTSPRAAAVDAQGNLIVAGTDASHQSVVLKLDPQLHTVFARALPASVYAVAADAAGNIYVTGTTASASFPVTPGAYQTKAPGGNPFGQASYAFVTEISSGGDQLLYSTYFGDDATYCFTGSSCIGAFGSTIAWSIALDPSGGAVIAGTTTAYRLPATPGALATTCSCDKNRSAGFVARFQPGAAQQLQWSTFLNAPGSASSGVAVSGLALDAAGNVIVGGSAPQGLPTTPGTIQPGIVSVPGTGDNGGFLVKLNNTGTGVVWGTYFGGSPLSFVRSIRVDAQGQVLFAGVTVDPAQAALPTNPSFRSTYVARMAGDATRLIDFYPAPYSFVGQDLTLVSTGGFAAMGQAGGLWIETTSPGPSLLAVVNSTGGGSLTAVARAELVSLYGVGIGPQTPLDGQVVNGVFTSSLRGYQVLFDGVPAPLLYAGSGQINAVVPSGVAGRTATHIQLVTPAGTVDGPTLSVASFVPGIFQNGKTGLAAALNQDGSINSPSNPARKGSIVTVFATGGGANYFPDGSLAPLAVYSANVPVWAVSGLVSLEVDFAGDAPGLVTGVMQVNFRVPDSPPPGNTLSFSLEIDGVSTGSSQVAIAP